MAAKQLAFDTQAREALLTGVQKIARAVKSTLGSRGRCAILDKGWGAPTVTKDGVTVAEEIELKDKKQNMGAQLVKEAASKTSDTAGDGTTTAMVLAEAIFAEGYKNLAAGADAIDIYQNTLIVRPCQNNSWQPAACFRTCAYQNRARYADHENSSVRKCLQQ